MLSEREIPFSSSGLPSEIFRHLNDLSISEKRTNMLRKSTLCAAAALALVSLFGTAAAADLQIYGRVDGGLIYHNYGGDSEKSDTFTMDSGTNTATRVGIQGSEALTESTKAIFRLENRFTSDTGAFNAYAGKTNRLFGGQSTFGLVNRDWGEITFGRVAGISSSTGPYDLQAYMDPFGGGTNGTGNAPVKSSRHDNMITYRSPVIGGVQATLQHSLKSDSNDEGEEGKSDVNRFYDAGLHYAAGSLHVAAVYERLEWGSAKQLDNGASEDREVATLGGSYRFEPVTVFLQTQYFKGLNAVDGFSSANLSETKNTRDGEIEGYGLYAGAEFWFGPSSWKWMAYWRDYELERKTGASYDGNTFGIANKFIYRPSKTVEFYVGAGYSEWDRLASKAGAVETLTDSDLNGYFGMTKYF